MKRLVYLYTAAVSLFLSTSAMANSSYTMPDADFKQFSCGYLEVESDRDVAVDLILNEIGSALSTQQQQTLSDIRESESAVQDLCSANN